MSKDIYSLESIQQSTPYKLGVAKSFIEHNALYRVRKMIKDLQEMEKEIVDILEVIKPNLE